MRPPSSCTRTSRRSCSSSASRSASSAGAGSQLEASRSSRRSTSSTSASTSISTPKTKEVTASDQKRLLVDTLRAIKIVDPLRSYQTLRCEAQRCRSRLGPVIESAIPPCSRWATFEDLVRDKREALMKQIAAPCERGSQELRPRGRRLCIKRADLPEQSLKSVFDRMRAGVGVRPPSSAPRARRRPAASRATSADRRGHRHQGRGDP